MNLKDDILAQSSLVGYWRLGYFDVNFNQFAKDLSSGKHHGAVQGGMSIGGGAPLASTDRLAASTSFTGFTTDWINVSHAASLAITGNMTILAIVSPTTLGSNRSVLQKGTSNLPRPYDYYVQVTDGKPVLVVGDGGAHASAAVTATAGVVAATPTMIGATISATTATHYLNGAANGSGSIAAATRSDAGDDLRIGLRADLIKMFGPMQDIAIFNAALSATQMLAFAVEAGYA